MFAATFLLCLVGGALIRAICVLADWGNPSVIGPPPAALGILGVERKEKQEIGMAEFWLVW